MKIICLFTIFTELVEAVGAKYRTKDKGWTAVQLRLDFR